MTSLTVKDLSTSKIRDNWSKIQLSDIELNMPIDCDVYNDVKDLPVNCDTIKYMDELSAELFIRGESLLSELLEAYADAANDYIEEIDEIKCRS